MAIKSADQITIVDVTDAYSVILTSETYTFIGNTSGAPSGLSCTTQVAAYCGTNQCTSVSVSASDITCPTGISASVSNSGSSAPTITFTTTATITNACEATIPVVVDGITVNKKFSFAVAKQGVTGATGAAGRGISSITNYYLATSSSSGVTTSTTGWTTTIQSVTSTKRYLWNYEKITYTDDSTANSSVRIIGTHGATGATGATGPAGADGADGKDAISLSITSSNGTVFKNSTGSTTLTAHVYKGGVEQTITDAGVCGSLGSIKWYKGTSTTAMATAKSITVSATDITNTVAYTCKLEG